LSISDSTRKVYTKGSVERPLSTKELFGMHWKVLKEFKRRRYHLCPRRN
jgi:hypothetical protein